MLTGSNYNNHVKLHQLYKFIHYRVELSIYYYYYFILHMMQMLNQWMQDSKSINIGKC